MRKVIELKSKRRCVEFRKFSFKCTINLKNYCLDNLASIATVLSSILLFSSDVLAGAYLEFNTNQVSGSGALALGHYNASFGDKTSTFGYGNVARGYASILVGTNNISGWRHDNQIHQFDPFFDPTSQNEILNISKEYINSIVPQRNLTEMVAFGVNNMALGEKSISLGNRNVSTNENSIAIGKSNLVIGDNAQGFGNSNTVKGSFSNAFGFKNFIQNGVNNSSALGNYNQVFESNAYAIGGNNSVKSQFSISYGYGNYINSNTENANAVGNNNRVSGRAANAFGTLNTIEGNSTLVLGVGNVVNGNYSVSIGSSFIGDNFNAPSLLLKSTVNANYSISIGHSNFINSNNTIAIGNFINASNNNLRNSVVLGDYSTIGMVSLVTNPIEVQFGADENPLIISRHWSGIASIENGTLSIGSRNKERQIKYVAPGAVNEHSTDAVNGSQLYSAITAIGNASTNFSMKFVGDDPSNFILKRIGETVVIYGGAQNELSQNNIGVYVSESKLKINLSKNISDISSITTDSGTILDDNGLRISNNGPSITKSGLNIKNTVISNVITNDTAFESDAANVGYVKKELQKLKNIGYELKADLSLTKTFEIGSTIELTGDRNITTTLTDSGVLIQLKSQLSGIQSLDIEGGPTINYEGFKFDESSKFTRNQIRMGNITINSDGKIYGVADPTDDTDAVNKRYVDRQLNSLGNKPLTLGTNDGQQSKKLGDTMTIKGADSNYDRTFFDGGNNIMTWIDDEGGVRIGIKKDITLSTFTSDDGSGRSSVLRSDALVFNGVDGLKGTNGQITLDVTNNGLRDVRNKKSARLRLNNTDVATMNDGLRFGVNNGKDVSNQLNSKVIVAGNKQNTDWTKFDDGRNIMTNISQNKEGQTNITIALKRDLELDSATFGHGTNIVEGTNTQKVGKDGYIKVVNKEGKTAIVIDGGNTSNDVGPSITVSDTKSVGGGLLYYLTV